MVAWRGLCGQSCPRQELEFLVQALVLVIVISVSLYNLTAGSDRERETFWASILSACVGIAIPGPLINAKKSDNKDRGEREEVDDSIELSQLRGGEIELDHNVDRIKPPE